MIILVPIFYDNDSLWAGDHGRELLEALFSRLANNAPGRTVVVSNRESVRQMAEGFGLEAVPAPCRDSDDRPYPAGTAVALEAVAHEDAGDRLIVNFKNPMLGGTLLHWAVREAAETDKPVLASSSQLRDHPCQIRSCLRLAQSAIIHFEDPDHRPEWLADHWTVTREFPHDWIFEGASENGIYRREKTLYDVILEPVDPTGEPAGSLWIKTADHAARIAYPRDKGDSAGFVRNGGFSAHAVTCFQGDHGPILRIARQSGPERVNIKTYPFNMDSISVQDVRAVDMGSNRMTVDIPIPDTSWHGALVHLHDVVQNGPYSHNEIFRPPNAPWFVRGDGKTVNLETKAIIQGRQEMPPVYDIDGSLFLLKKGHSLPTRETLLEQMSPMIIEPCYSMHLNTRMDYLWHKAKKRTVANA